MHITKAISWNKSVKYEVWRAFFIDGVLFYAVFFEAQK